MTFHRGQKVVCIADSWSAHSTAIFSSLPCKGKIYSVRKVNICPVHGEQCLELEGINGPIYPFDNSGDEFSFAADRFRPLVEKKTDISVFKKLEIPAPKQLERA